MIQGFWQTLTHPIIGLAPMDGVTDAAFRYMVSSRSKPAVTFTEFTSVDGLYAGAERLLEDFRYAEQERPIVAQLFGGIPEHFYDIAIITASLGFDGIDINMGCPAKNVTQHGAGASLIADPPRAKAIIQQTKAGLRDWLNGKSITNLDLPPSMVQAITQRIPNEVQRRDLPVSVKTRIGISDIVITDWVQHLLEEQPAAITIHGRTLKQLYTGEANWQAIVAGAQAIKSTPTLVLGNGDIQSMPDALAHVHDYGVDGVLVGRATFGNPWFFADYTPTPTQRIQAAVEHARLQELHQPGHFIKIRKHLLDYSRGWDGAKAVRQQFMRVTTLADVERIAAAALADLQNS